QGGVKSILDALLALAGLFVRPAVVLHHPPRKVDPLGAVDVKKEILPAKNLGAAFFALAQRQALIGHRGIALPHDVADDAGYPLADVNRGNHSARACSWMASRLANRTASSLCVGSARH